MSGWDHARLNTLPALFPSDGKQPGIHMAKYKHWMGLPFEGHAPVMSTPHLATCMRYELQRCLMRFRMCCWPLAANRANGISRNLRTCRACGSGAVEDEEHVLLACPAYADLRVSAQLPGGSPMKIIMLSFDQVKLAALLKDIWARREASVAYEH